MYPELEKVRAMSDLKSYGVVPVSVEILSDQRTPIEVLKTLKNVSKHCYMLESADSDKRWGRYTFLGYDPILELTCTNHQLIIKTGMTIQKQVEHPGIYIRNILEEYRSPKIKDMPPFTGGFVGYFSYDYIRYRERVLTQPEREDENFKDVDLMLFDKVIVFDHYQQKMILIANIKIDELEENYKKAEQELLQMKTFLLEGKKVETPVLKLDTTLKPIYSKEQYIKMVEQAKKYIYEGDIFQVVLSNQLEAKCSGSLFDTYRILRTTNPSPYMFYFSSDDIEIAGASPETLIKLENHWLYTYPLAGTKPRGKTQKEDEALEQELLRDEKELAEHNMLVDLGRNDIGRISDIGSVRVESYQKVLRFSHVMHIGSTVIGRIQRNKDSVDALDSILPAGTLSGAPKIRACQIIDELETKRRGIYGGAIGYLDFTGNMDTCIAIRLVYKKNGKVFVRSGAGIVKDSNPEKEYEECINKAKAMINAIDLTIGGTGV